MNSPFLCTLYNFSDSTEVDLRDFRPFILLSSKRIQNERGTMLVLFRYEKNSTSGWENNKEEKFELRGNLGCFIPTGGNAYLDSKNNVTSWAF